MVEEYEDLIEGLAERGYGLVDNFLDPILVDNLIANIEAKREEDELKKAGVGKLESYIVNRSIRGDYINWFSENPDNEWELLYLERIKGLIAYLNRTCFTAINDWEFHYALYPKGTFYKKHFDRFRNDDRRKYSLISYLNKDWKSEYGGQLVMHFNDKKVEILPLAGRVVFFEADKILHEVLPAQEDRMSITGWLKI